MRGAGRRRGPLPAQRKRADAKKEQHARTRKKSQKYLQLKSQEEDRRRRSATFKPPSSADFQNAADRQKIEAAQNIQAGSNVATIILALAGVRAAGALVSLGANAMFGGYSRDQEREADSRGAEFVRTAGFNVYGALRLFEKISAKHGDHWGVFLASHPSHAERTASMRALAESSPTERGPNDITRLALTVPIATRESADEPGEYSAVVHDTEERVPTLHQRVICTLPDGSQESTTKIDCVQRDGAYSN